MNKKLEEQEYYTVERAMYSICRKFAEQIVKELSKSESKDKHSFAGKRGTTC